MINLKDIIPSISADPLGLYLSRNLIELTNLWCSNSRKCACESQNWKWAFLLMPPSPSKTLQHVLIITPPGRFFVSFYLLNLSMQIYSGLSSIPFLTLLQIIIIFLCGCCYYSKHLNYQSSNDCSIISFVSFTNNCLYKQNRHS